MSRALGDFAILHGVEQLSDEGRRNLILRAQAHVGGRSRAIIIKATRSRKYEASSADIFAGSGLVRKWVARELLAQSPEHNSSALLAGDAEHGLIVFDDFGSDLPSMDAMLLRGTPAAAEAALVAYATALGRLHVATIDCVKSHAAIIRKTFSAAAIPVCTGGDWMEAPLPEIDGVTIPEAEANFIRSRLVEPGRWLALVHGELSGQCAFQGWPCDPDRFRILSSGTHVARRGLLATWVRLRSQTGSMLSIVMRPKQFCPRSPTIRYSPRRWRS